jgi:hypothetical protein
MALDAATIDLALLAMSIGGALIVGLWLSRWR